MSGKESLCIKSSHKNNRPMVWVDISQKDNTINMKKVLILIKVKNTHIKISVSFHSLLC